LPRLRVARWLSLPDWARRRAVRAHILAIAFLSLLTVAVTWPLVLHFGSKVPGWYIADNYEYLWKMWWFKHALLDLHQSPLVAPQLFYPQGFQLANAELSPLLTVVGLPFTWLWGEIPTYNLLSLLSFIVAGWATFALVYRITGNGWAGILAGTLFALTPYHVERYAGILPSASVEGIPVFFLGLELWAQERRKRWALLASLGFILAAWAYLYYAAGLLLLGPVYALARLRPIRQAIRQRQVIAGAGLIGAISLAGLIPLAVPYLQLSRQIELKIPLEEVDFWSASLTDYLIPPGLHPLWGAWVREHLLGVAAEYPQIGLEFVLGVGFICILFAAYSISHHRGPAKSAVVWLTLMALLFSLGPTLHVGRHPLVIPTSANLAAGFERAMNGVGEWLPGKEAYGELGANGVTIPLPALLLRWLIPPAEGMRAWNRLAVFVALGLAVLAGAGYSSWIQEEILHGSPPDKVGSRKVRMAGIIVLSLAIFELWPAQIPLQPVQPRTVDLWLADQPGQFTIMELPLNSALSAPQMLYSRYHGKRTAFAYGTFFPYWYRQQYPELAGCPAQACLDRLRSWGVRYILLNIDALPPGSTLETDLETSDAIRRITTLDQIVVFQLLS
jgi:hypothetical protein